MGQIKNLLREQSTIRKPLLCSAAAAVGLMLGSPRLAAQEYEWEADEGFHQEEWYDPSDWFDTTPGVDYEQDWWDTTQEYEWEADEGFHEEEWYDPSDWFDTTTGVDYERDAWDTTPNTWGYWSYDYDLYEDPDNNTWSTATTDLEDNNQNYGWHYDWNPVRGTWRSDYGYYQREYNFDARNDYGWHYDWNPQSESWESDYGWHSSNWDYDYTRFDYGQQNQDQELRAQTSAQRERQRDQQRARSASGQTRDLHVAQGEIESLRRVNMRNQQGQRTLASVRLDDGKRVVIDFGSRNAQNLGVNEGDQVVMRGRTVSMGGRDILVAQQVRIDGRQFTVPGTSQREQQTAQERRQSQQVQQQGQGRGPQQERGQGQNVEIRGQLQDLQRANLDGVRENHTLARVTLQNGREAIVDLGSNFEQRYGQDRVRQLLQRASEGDQILVRGERQRVNGREIIKARQFRLEGESMLRSSGQQGRNQQQQDEN